MREASPMADINVVRTPRPDRPPLWRRLILWELIQGLSVTLIHNIRTFIKEPFTVQYPEERLPLQPRFRGYPRLRSHPETGEELCIGCLQCEFACAVAHSATKDMYAIVASGERPGHRITVEAYGRKAIPVNCNHCEEPACIMACPTGSVYRREEGGPVLVDREYCIGCHMCVQACPFGVMAMRCDGKAVFKCDLCITRLAKGLEPACVSSCPTGAPAIRSSGRVPVLPCTRTPTRYSLPPCLTTREAVPVPPLKPCMIIPVPPPTLPSATGPEPAASMASKT